MKVYNVTEFIVRSTLDDRLKKMDCCKCESCYNDMMAIALNRSKPHYVNTTKGELLVRLDATDRQKAVDVEISVLYAIEIVTNNPRH